MPRDDLRQILREEAEKRGLQRWTPVFEEIIQAESGWNPNAHNTQGENSVGLWQMNIAGGLGSGHSVEELKDPRRNIQLALDNIRRGYASGIEGGRPEADAMYAALQPWSTRDVVLPNKAADLVSVFSGQRQGVGPPKKPPPTEPGKPTGAELLAGLRAGGFIDEEDDKKKPAWLNWRIGDIPIPPDDPEFAKQMAKWLQDVAIGKTNADQAMDEYKQWSANRRAAMQEGGEIARARQGALGSALSSALKMSEDEWGRTGKAAELALSAESQRADAAKYAIPPGAEYYPGWEPGGTQASSWEQIFGFKPTLSKPTPVTLDFGAAVNPYLRVAPTNPRSPQDFLPITQGALGISDTSPIDPWADIDRAQGYLDERQIPNYQIPNYPVPNYPVPPIPPPPPNYDTYDYTTDWMGGNQGQAAPSLPPFDWWQLVSTPPG